MHLGINPASQMSEVNWLLLLTSISLPKVNDIHTKHPRCSPNIIVMMDFSMPDIDWNQHNVIGYSDAANAEHCFYIAEQFGLS